MNLGKIDSMKEKEMTNEEQTKKMPGGSFKPNKSLETIVRNLGEENMLFGKDDFMGSGINNDKDPKGQQLKINLILQKFKAKDNTGNTLLSPFAEFNPKLELISNFKLCNYNELYKVTLSNSKHYLLKISKVNSGAIDKLTHIINEYYIGKALGAMTKNVAKILGMKIIDNTHTSETRIEILQEWPGESLNQNFEYGIATEIACQLIQTLIFLEDRGIGHKNLNPDIFGWNNETSMLKLIDFTSIAPKYCIKNNTQLISLEKSEVNSFGTILEKLFHDKVQFNEIISVCKNSKQKNRPTLQQVKYMMSRQIKKLVTKKLIEIPHLDFKILGETYDLLQKPEKSTWYYKKFIRIIRSTSLAYEMKTDIELAKAYNKLGISYHKQNNIEKAIKYQEYAKDIMIKTYGEYSIEIANLYNNLGIAYSESNNYNKALDCFLKEEGIIGKIKGDNSQEIAKISNYLGNCYSELKEKVLPMQFHEKSLNIYKKLYGDQHADVAETYSYYGKYYIMLGKNDLSLDYLMEAKRIIKNLLGGVNVNLASVYINMGVAWKNMGNIKASEKCYFKAEGIILKNYGNCHPILSTIYTNLAILAKSKKDFKNAINFQENAVKINPKNLDSYYRLGLIYQESEDYKNSILCILKTEENPNYLLNLGNLHQLLKEEKKAIEYTNKFPEFCEDFLEHIIIEEANTLNSSGKAYNILGDYNNSIEKYQAAEKILINPEIENYDSAPEIYFNLGVTLNEQGEYQKAIENFTKSEQLSDGSDSDLTGLYINIGLAYKNNRDFSEALKYLHKAEGIKIKEIGNQHPGLAIIYNNIGNVYKCMRNYKQAIEYHEKSKIIRVSIYGNNHPEVACSYNNLGVAYYDIKNYEKAIDCFDHAISIWQKLDSKLGLFYLADAYDNQGLAFTDSNNPKKAIDLHKKAEEIRKKHHSISLISTYNNLAKAYFAVNEHETAINEYQKAVKFARSLQNESTVELANAFLGLALGNYLFKEYKIAIEYCLKAEKIYVYQQQDLLPIYRIFAILYNETGEYEKSIEFYKKVVNLIPQEDFSKLSMLYYNLAKVHSNRKDYAEGIKYLKKIIANSNKLQEEFSLKIYGELGNFYNKIGLYNKAFECYQQKLVKPCDLETYNILGMLCFKIEDYRKALEYFNLIEGKILDKNSKEMADLWENLGETYLKLNEFDKSLANFKNSERIKLQLYGENNIALAGTYIHIGTAYSKAINKEKSLEYFNKAEKLIQQNAKEANIASLFYLNLAGAYKSWGKKQEAENYFIKAHELKSLNEGLNVADEYISFGMLYNKDEKVIKIAKLAFERAIKIYSSESSEKHSIIAKLYSYIGKSEDKKISEESIKRAKEIENSISTL